MNQKGKLRIFFSYADGAGKTWAMLRAAKAEQRGGRRVLIGSIGARTRKSYNAIPCLLPRRVQMDDRVQMEFDLDRALAAQPQLLLLCDLAHTNAGTGRHTRRYQDVEELLRAGIDVYTTLNVGQLEGMHEAVGGDGAEWIPDAIFDAADQVEFVDVDPEELLDRRGGVAAEELHRLNLLRQLALQRCADRIGRTCADVRAAGAKREHILVCLSAAPSNAKVIRMAIRMADAFRGSCTALFVRNPAMEPLRSGDQQRLTSNMKLAGQLGAKMEIVTGEDVAFQIAEYARLSGVTQIVLGRSVAAHERLVNKQSIADRLIQLVPGTEIHIIPDGESQQKLRRPVGRLRAPHVTPSDMVKSLAILVMATALSLVFYELGFSEANIIMAYILGVLVTAVTTSNRLCSSASSIASVIIFNYLFTEPRFTLNAYDTGYPVTFLVMLAVALMTGSLAYQLKAHARESAQTAYRTRILFETNQQLSQAADRDAILSVTAVQLVKLFRRNVVIYPVEGDALGEASLHTSPELEAPDALADERKVAEWTFRNNRQAGATTDTFAQARGLYLAIRINDRVYGVAGIAMGDQSLSAAEHGMLLAILGECALAMENEKNVREKEAAAMQARSEQLRADLLRTISHDLRTPLTAISGNASNLISNGAGFDEATRQQIYTDIRDDAHWLINLVENLLYVTRIEDGRMKLRCSVELMDEVLQEALRHESCETRNHSVVLRRTEDLLLARIDARLIIQVILNLVDNALKYTPPGSHIELSARRDGRWIRVRCADDGPGISDEDKAHIFEMFYCGSNHSGDSRRSLGLGLGLCKSIVSAHGGEIRVFDNQPCGTVFEFTVPAEEVQLNEQ